MVPPQPLAAADFGLRVTDRLANHRRFGAGLRKSSVFSEEVGEGPGNQVASPGVRLAAEINELIA